MHLDKRDCARILDAFLATPMSPMIYVHVAACLRKETSLAMTLVPITCHCSYICIRMLISSNRLLMLQGFGVAKWMGCGLNAV